MVRYRFDLAVEPRSVKNADIWERFIDDGSPGNRALVTVHAPGFYLGEFVGEWEGEVLVFDSPTPIPDDYVFVEARITEMTPMASEPGRITIMDRECIMEWLINIA